MPLEKKLYFNCKSERKSGVAANGYSDTPFLTATVSVTAALETVSICQCRFKAKTAVETGLISIANPELHTLTTFTGPDEEISRIWAALANRPALEVKVPNGACRLQVRLKR